MKTPRANGTLPLYKRGPASLANRTFPPSNEAPLPRANGIKQGPHGQNTITPSPEENSPSNAPSDAAGVKPSISLIQQQDLPP